MSALAHTPITASASAGRGDDLAVTIVVPGEPKGKARPRFWNGRAVTATATRSYENDLRAIARSVMRGRPIFEAAVTVEAWAVMPIPASWSARRKAAAVSGSVVPTGKPDGDNILKCVDALNGVVWRDDAQIADAHVHKRYGAEPRLVLMIRPLLASPSDRATQPPL